MLRRPANLVMRWGLAGILGVTSLLGSGLHDLVGIHHAGLFNNDEARALACESAPAVTASPTARCDDANCPICNFLAQGRIVGEQFQGISVTVHVPNRSPIVPLLLPTPRLQPFQARAPPAA